MKYFNTLQYARENRKTPTKAENYFWNRVRSRKLFGLKFNRQFIIEYAEYQGNKLYYIADFHNFEHKVIIEIDGNIHDIQQEYDKERQEQIELLGYSVIRFTNEEVLQKWDKVKETLRRYFTHPQPLP